MANEYDMPYYLPEPTGGTRKHFESLIPIAILVIIGIILLGRSSSVFCAVPCLGSVLCGTPSIQIGVIGSFTGTRVVDNTTVIAPELKLLLESPQGASYGITFQEFTPNLFTYAGDQLLANFDMVILVGDRAFNRRVKDSIGTYIANGGKLMIIGDSAISDPDDPLAKGWGIIDGIPVRLSNEANIDLPIRIGSGDQPPAIQIADINHQISKGYFPVLNLGEVRNKPTCNRDLQLIETLPNSNGKVIAFLSGITGAGTPKDIFGIVEGGTPLGGKIIYFAYDPGCT